MVHCSDGSGRTGIVIFNLLCYDNLNYHREVNFLNLVKEIRDGRAQLIETETKFNFSLNVLDELLFGFTTVVPEREILQKTLELVRSCGRLYSRLTSLPSGIVDHSLSYTAINCHYNRSHAILPSISHAAFIDVSHILYLTYFMYSILNILLLKDFSSGNFNLLKLLIFEMNINNPN